MARPPARPRGPKPLAKKRRGKSAAPPRLRARVAAAPKARVKKTPKSKGAGRKGHPIHGNMFSITHSIPTPVAQACGSALPYSGIFRRELTVNTTERVLVFFTNTGRAGTVATVVGLSNPPVATAQTIPTLALADDAGGPTSAKAMKAGVFVSCVTAPLNRAGRVTVLNAKQRILLPAGPGSMSLAQFNTVIDAIKAHPDSLSYTASDFTHPTGFHCHPVDSRVYDQFFDFHGAVSADDMVRSLAVWPGVDPFPRPLSGIVMIFELPPTPQEYTLSFRASFYTRWPLNTIPGQTQRKIPTAPLGMINNHMTLIENVGSRGVPENMDLDNRYLRG